MTEKILMCTCRYTTFNISDYFFRSFLVDEVKMLILTPNNTEHYCFRRATNQMTQTIHFEFTVVSFSFIGQGSPPNSECKESDRKYPRLCGPHDLQCPCKLLSSAI